MVPSFYCLKPIDGQKVNSERIVNSTFKSAFIMIKYDQMHVEGGHDNH